MREINSEPLLQAACNRPQLFGFETSEDVRSSPEIWNKLLEEFEALRLQLNGSDSPNRAHSEERRSDDEVCVESSSAFEEQQALLIEAERVANLGSWSWDVRSGGMKWSDNLCKMCGFEPDEFDWRFETALSLIHPADIEVVEENLRSLLELKKPIRFEHRIRTRDGSERTVTASQRVFTDDHGRVVKIAGILQDITERKLAEAALRESESKYRTVFEKSADAILIIEGDKFVDCNAATVEMLGYRNKKELLETHPSQLSPETQPDGKNSYEKANEMMEIAFKRGSHRFEWDHMRQNGEVFPVEVLLTAAPIGDRSFLHVVWRDITERKRLQELESRAARLDTAGTIAGQVAHDFNNLLAPLVAFPEFIRERLEPDHPAQSSLRMMEQAAQKIADINQQLLTLGRRGHYTQSPINLNNSVQEVVKEISPIGENISCELELDPELMSVLAGGAQIHRVIYNLVVNAIDALQGRGSITIRTENFYADDVVGAYGRVPKGEYVKLTVSDTGCGIPDDIVQKALDPFFTTKTTDKRRGSGLGLSVVDAVVKDHGGFLDLVTELGKGTSFYLYFPPTRMLSDVRPHGETPGGTEKILVVDDDVVQREVSTHLLERLGYTVNSVDCGEKAIEFLRENPQDLLVLDMIMPDGIDGTETFQRVLEFSPTQKAIIVSGYSETDRAQAAKKLGVGAFVKKPLTRESIARAVRAELDRKESTPVSH